MLTLGTPKDSNNTRGDRVLKSHSDHHNVGRGFHVRRKRLRVGQPNVSLCVHLSFSLLPTFGLAYYQCTLCSYKYERVPRW